jgi:FO synthase
MGDSVRSHFSVILDKALANELLSVADGYHLIRCADEETPALLAAAGALRDRYKGRTVTYSRKVFLPVTNLCRDRCSYCTFRKDPTTSACGWIAGVCRDVKKPSCA